CRAHSRRRRAAASTRAALTRWSAAAARSRRSCARRGASSPATSTRASSRLAPEADDVERGDGLREALEREAAQVLHLDEVLDRAEDALGDEDLPGLRLAAEPRREVRHRADRAVVHPPLEANRADRGVALGDADAEVELVAALLPFHEQLIHAPAHHRGHPDRALGRVRDGHGVVEKDHHAVAGEALERALVLEDEAAHLCVILAEHAHHLLGLGGLGERREAAQVEEDHGDLAAVSAEGVLSVAADDQLRELGREEALETLEALELGKLLLDELLEGPVRLRE